MPQSTEPHSPTPKILDQIAKLEAELARATAVKEYAQKTTSEWATQLDKDREKHTEELANLRNEHSGVMQALSERNAHLQLQLQDAEDAKRALAARLHQSEYQKEKLEGQRGQDKSIIGRLKAQMEVAHRASGDLEQLQDSVSSLKRGAGEPK